ncbi:MAG: PQQ-binding-like beta-propeller repeat protein [Ignavibacteriaceae bacterium]
MRIFFSIVCLFYVLPAMIFAQEFKFAWLTDIHSGASGAESDLQNIVADINSRNDIEFVVVTGNITETGSSSELQKAEEILDALNTPYYVIPGPHDTRWSESGCLEFNYLWGSENFIFDHNGTRHIGINSSICWQGGGGHISPQNIAWLQQIFDTTNVLQEIYIYVHHPLNNTIDNWYQVTNLLAGKNIKAVFTGFTDVNANPSFCNIILNYNGVPAAAGRSAMSSKAPAAKKRASRKTGENWGYTFVESRTDSLLFYELTAGGSPVFWGGIPKNETLQIPHVDSAQNKVYSDNITIKWQKELNSEMYASLLTSEDKIFAVTKNGFVYCYDLNGNLKWKYDTGETILSKPVRDKDILVVATVEGDLFSFNANNGSVIQVLSIGEPLTSQLIKTDITYNGYQTKGAIAGTASGKIFCYDMYSLEQVWENNSAKGLINTEPLLINNRIIYGSWDNNLYCIDSRSGSLNWKWQNPDQKSTSANSGFSYFSPAGCTPVSDGKQIYIAAPDKYVTAIDFLLGRTVWRKNNFNCWESIGLSNDKKNLLIKSMRDKIYIVSGYDGKQVNEINAGYGFDVTPTEPIEWNGSILFGAGNGNIYIIDGAYNAEPVLFTGTARVNTVEQIKDNLFAVSNMDGDIFVFELK